jgi:hypothetical protein
MERDTQISLGNFECRSNETAGALHRDFELMGCVGHRRE